jgi:hypothetical protein
MKTFEMDCFEVRESDGDGRSDHHVAFVSTKALADELIGKQSGWRSSQPYKKIITVYDNMEEIEANSKTALKKAALAKLTMAEKQALGLL